MNWELINRQKCYNEIYDINLKNKKVATRNCKEALWELSCNWTYMKLCKVQLSSSMRSKAGIEKYDRRDNVNAWDIINRWQRDRRSKISKLFIVNNALSLDSLAIETHSIAWCIWSIEVQREKSLDFSLTIDLLCQSFQCRSHCLKVWSQSCKMLTYMIDLSVVSISWSYWLSEVFVWISRVLLKSI